MSDEIEDRNPDPIDDGDRGLGDLLGAFMGAGSNASPGSGGDFPGGMDLDSLMGALGTDAAGGGGGTGDDLGGLLGSLLGGGGSGGGSADMLGSLLGGGSGGGMGGLLAGLLGGAGSGTTNTFGGGGGPMLPFADTLAEKLGISPQMANALVAAAMGLIMSKLSQQRSGDLGANGLTMNSLMDPDYLRESGVAAQVAQQTGMDEDEAIHGLQEAIGLAGRNVSGATNNPPAADESDLKGLLDSWD